MPEFIPGLKLNELFYHEVIKPILVTEFPGLNHSAARLGHGSEVLGYDTPLSADHDWGLRLQLFLAPADYEQYATAVRETVRHKLPAAFRGYATYFGPPDDEGVRHRAEIESGPVDHRIEVHTIKGFFEAYMAFDPYREPAVFDWLTWPQQHLLGVTKGQVYADGLGELEAIRQKLAYYPRDVWLYLLAMQWCRIGQEEAFVGRAGDVGDELGSAVLAARLVHDIMQLCFLMERKYAPYPKWFGAAFAELDCAPRLSPILQQVFLAPTWREREKPLCMAYELAAAMHNDLGITAPLPTAVTHFHGRPYLVISADRFVDAIKNAISDETVKNIRTQIGSIDQFSHSTDLRSYPQLHKRLQALYE